MPLAHTFMLRIQLLGLWSYKEIAAAILVKDVKLVETHLRRHIPGIGVRTSELPHSPFPAADERELLITQRHFSAHSIDTLVAMLSRVGKPVKLAIG